jgi:hypothetical protein
MRSPIYRIKEPDVRRETDKLALPPLGEIRYAGKGAAEDFPFSVLD